MRLLSWIGGIVVVIWLLGFIFKIGGSLIHLLLVVAAVVFLLDVLSGRKR